MSQSSKISWKRLFSPGNLFLMIVGVFCAVIALKGFMIPNHFLDGGVTGISIILHEVTHMPVALFLILLNLPFLYLGYIKIGKQFTLHSALAILLLFGGIQFIDVPVITDDKVLIAIFGGVLIGLGIGLVIRSGGVIDGFEIFADYTDKKSSFKSTEIILFINTLLFLSIAYFFGLEAVMYSILTYFTAAKTTDYVVDGFEQYISLTIISKEDEKVKSIVVNDYNKAITVYKGERGFLPGQYEVHEDCDIVVAVVTRLELYRIKRAIQKVDPSAFLVVSSIREIGGGVVKKRQHH